MGEMMNIDMEMLMGVMMFAQPLQGMPLSVLREIDFGPLENATVGELKYMDFGTIEFDIDAESVMMDLGDLM